MLELGSEHISLVAHLGCVLAKHRKSDYVERKDLQLAYGTFGSPSRRSLLTRRNGSAEAVSRLLL